MSHNNYTGWEMMMISHLTINSVACYITIHTLEVVSSTMFFPQHIPLSMKFNELTSMEHVAGTDNKSVLSKHKIISIREGKCLLPHFPRHVWLHFLLYTSAIHVPSVLLIHDFVAVACPLVYLSLFTKAHNKIK